MHRIPLSAIKCVFVEGAVRLDEIEYQGAVGPPDTPRLEAGADADFQPVTVQKPAIPFVQPLAGFAPPRKFSLTGTPKMNASRFEVNFKAGDEFALHFRVDVPCQKCPKVGLESHPKTVGYGNLLGTVAVTYWVLEFWWKVECELCDYRAAW